jgi:hypothetical protein
MLRLYGVLLFLFIPIVLFLYLTFPIGVIPSILLGIFLMFGHRFIARPFMMKNLAKRDIWDGSVIKVRSYSFDIVDSKERFKFYSNNGKNMENSIKFFNFIRKHRVIIGPAILATVFWYLISVLISEIFPSLRYLSNDTMITIFKLLISITVVAVSFIYRLGSTTVPVQSVFPSHNLFLLGIRWTLWIFRLVGFWWLVVELRKTLFT